MSSQESVRAGLMEIRPGKVPPHYLVCGPAVRKGDAEEKLLEKVLNCQCQMKPKRFTGSSFSTRITW